MATFVVFHEAALAQATGSTEFPIEVFRTFEEAAENAMGLTAEQGRITVVAKVLAATSFEGPAAYKVRITNVCDLEEAK